MELGTLRQIRRALSAAVAVCAVALVMVKMQGPPPRGTHLGGLLVSLSLVTSLVAFVMVWRKEHAANEAAFAERERAQLMLIRMQVELARKKQQDAAGAEASRRDG